MLNAQTSVAAIDPARVPAADSANPGTLRPLAMLVKRFPRLSETFVFNEIVELRRQDIPLRLFAIMDPHEPHVQPEAAAMRQEVSYLRKDDEWQTWIGLWGCMIAAAFAHPRGFAGAVRFALSRGTLTTWKHLAEATRLVRMLDAMNAGHLHAHFAHGPSSVAYLAHRICGISFSFTAHAKDLYTTNPATVSLRARSAEFVVTCTAANGEYLAGLMGSQAGQKLHVLPHGVDLQRFGAVERRPVGGRILSIGRMVPKKGFDRLVRALGIVASRGVRFDCRIFGGGPLSAAVQSDAVDAGIAHLMHLGGARTQGDLLVEYAHAELFALSPVVTDDGDRDGVPNVLIEAMACGIPVVATVISGIPELIEDGVTGVLVPPDDPAALAAAIERLLGDEALRRRLGEAGRRRIFSTRALDGSVLPLAHLFRARLNRLRSTVGVGAGDSREKS